MSLVTPMNKSSRIQMRHVTHMNGSCHTYEWVMLHTRTGVTNKTASCHTYEWVMSHIWMRHVPQVQAPIRDSESRHTYEWVIYNWKHPFVTLSPATHIQESCTPIVGTHSWLWVMSHVWMSRVRLKAPRVMWVPSIVHDSLIREIGVWLLLHTYRSRSPQL